MEQLNKLITLILFDAFAGLLFFGKQPATAVHDPWFEQAVLKCDRPVVVKFGAEWCGPCRSMDSALDSLESTYSQSARFLRVDIDKKPEIFNAYRSSGGIPQIMIFRNGEVVALERGFGGQDNLNSWLASNLK